MTQTLTTEECEEIVREACYKANPEIVELKFGCRLDAPGGRTKIITDVFTNIKSDDWNFIVREEVNQQPHREVRKSEMLHYGVIGRTIGLCDVLVALANDETISIDSHVSGIGFYFRVVSENPTNSQYIRWDLLSDNLLLQSPETKQLLASLLK